MHNATTPYALVVDDDPIIQMDACQILEEAGYRCLTADTGDEAKVILDDHGAAIMLVFSDIEMPGETDGFALARYVLASSPDTDVVLASGRVTPAAHELSEGVTFIAKPFTTGVVINHLSRTLPDQRKPVPLRSPT